MGFELFEQVEDEFGPGVGVGGVITVLLLSPQPIIQVRHNIKIANEIV